MSSNLVREIKFTRALNFTATATTTLSGSVIDMQGHGSVTWMVGFGTILAGATPSIHFQESAATTATTFVNLAGTSISVATTNANDVAAVEVVEPQKRYVRGQVVRAGASAGVDFGLILQGRPKVEPVTQDSATIVSVEVHASPATGTA